MATEKEERKESERTLALAQQVADLEANKPTDWTGGTYGQQVQDALDKILNREQFSYNLNADPLYQQYKDQYMRGGKLAMQDTMGQAAQLTGGYGNSYAATAGNQAYQGYLTGLNDKVPDLYSLALSKYSSEGDAMRDNLGALQGMYAQEYAQHQQKVNDYRTELDRLDSLYADSQAYDYQSARDAVADAQWQAEFDEAVRQWNLQWEKQNRGGGGYKAPTGMSEEDLKTVINLAVEEVGRSTSGREVTQRVDEVKQDVTKMISDGTITQQQGELIIQAAIDTGNARNHVR